MQANLDQLREWGASNPPLAKIQCETAFLAYIPNFKSIEAFFAKLCYKTRFKKSRLSNTFVKKLYENELIVEKKFAINFVQR